jgi:DNA damage-binding protein 1
MSKQVSRIDDRGKDWLLTSPFPLFIPIPLDTQSWREFRSDKRTIQSTNFVDGDLIELFLDLSQDEINDVLEGADGGEPIKVPVEEITKLVEELSRLH